MNVRKGARVLLCLLIATLSAAAGMSRLARAEGEYVPPATEFSRPLGYRDGDGYAPRMTYAGGVLIENTNYGIRNMDLVGVKCFGATWDQLYHAGEDLYRTDGTSTAGAEVTAIADGRVAYANPFLNYPGLVVILAHRLPAGDLIYSVYAHIDDNSIEVAEGDIVKRGQRLGAVLYQSYAGRYPEFHLDGDDSHLHFEIRHFMDASTIYAGFPACNGLIPGVGYTYPRHPNDFPAPGAGYVNPSTFLTVHMATPTPTVSPTATPSATPTTAPSATPTATATPLPSPTPTPRPAGHMRLPLLLVI
jgi:murein DD-endopeptidase MepM/ murein hydrolase activator NlpD